MRRKTEKKVLSALSCGLHLLPNDLFCCHGNHVGYIDDLVAIVCKGRILTKWWCSNYKQYKLT